MIPNTSLYRSKRHYEILDGLRGVAAVIVVIFHLFETYYMDDPIHHIINHGYLAVDFFFVLSGFVVGYAYDDRWGTKLNVKKFFKRRLIRLHPMLVMGTLIGGLLYFFGKCPMFPLIGQVPWWTLLLLFLLACTMLPALPSMDIRGWQETNSFNGATWTLLWEYLANILYAVFFRRLSKTLLALVTALAAVLTLDLTLNINIFGLLGSNRPINTVIGGWSINPEQAYIGLTRLFYPFLAGLLLSRIGKHIKTRGGFWWCSLILAAILVMPRIGGTEHMWMNGAYEAFCILLIFPLIVMLGAGSEVTDNRSRKVCKFFGDISYPLYVTHYPLIYAHIAWVQNNPRATLSENIYLSVSVFFCAIGLAYACLKLYDIPVRRWLTDKVKEREFVREEKN